MVCADDLARIKETIEAAYLQAEYQRCIVHQVRNTLRYISYKDYKSFSNDFKKIYHAPNKELALKALDEVSEYWREKYPQVIKNWYSNWNALSPFFKFSTGVRKIIYTTNVIESLNATYRKLNTQRPVFPNNTSLKKLFGWQQWKS